MEDAAFLDPYDQHSGEVQSWENSVTGQRWRWREGKSQSGHLEDAGTRRAG